jgi:Tfp pilus assembly PilM family ATPase
MPKLLAVDWDRCEVRYVYASAHGAQLRILAAESVVIAEAEERSDAETAQELGTQLRAALERNHVGQTPTLVGIDRTGLELLPLTLPPAADAELPDLVANEVLRESASVADGAAFDFVALGTDSAAPRKVLAAVLPLEQRERIDAMLAAAGLQARRLLPRIFAAAALFPRLVPPSEEWHLLVHPGAEEADFLVFRGGRIVFARTARMPSTGDEERDAWLLSEIHRTLTVAATETGEASIVEGVYVFGGHEEYRALCERVRQDLLLPAHGVDPLEKYECPAELAVEHPGRFAALLGMLADEGENRPPAMDFLHPHRAPRRLSRVKAAAFAAVAVLVVVLLAGGYVWQGLSKQWQLNRQLASQLKELDGRVRQAAKTRRLAAAIQAWQAGDVVWLEELREFSERFPPARDALVLRLQMSSLPAGGGLMTMQGLVRDPSLIVRLEYALRDAYHAVQSRRIQSGSRPNEEYTHLFDASIVVSKRQKEDYRSP